MLFASHSDKFSISSKAFCFSPYDICTNDNFVHFVYNVLPLYSLWGSPLTNIDDIRADIFLPLCDATLDLMAG